MKIADSAGGQINEIVREARHILEAGLVASLGFVVVMTAISVYIDTNGLEGGGDILISVANLAAGYVLTIQLIRRSALVDGALPKGFGTYFGLAIFSGIGMFVGYLLFIIPGIILTVRWSAAYGFAMAGGENIFDAMGKSWQATEQHFWPIMMILIFPTAALVGAVLVLAFAFETSDLLSVPVSFAANALIYTSTVAFTVIGLAVYSLLGASDRGLPDVFD